MLTVLTNIRSTKVLWLVGTAFVGRQPSVEDDLWWKMTFGGEKPLVEDNDRWKLTFGVDSYP